MVRLPFKDEVENGCETVLEATSPQPKAVGFQDAELQLAGNIIEVERTLYWVTSCSIGDDEGFARDGSRLESWRPHDIEGSVKVVVHLFAGDYSNRHRCAGQLLLDAHLCDERLEAAVLNPSRHVNGSLAPLAPFKTDLMNINDEQRRAVAGLSTRVAVIHGLPGTGKSTTIFHILSTRLASGALAIVTCVTNQAIDAIAEKLQRTHHVCPMLVLWNEDRNGGQVHLEGGFASRTSWCRAWVGRAACSTGSSVRSRICSARGSAALSCQPALSRKSSRSRLRLSATSRDSRRRGSGPRGSLGTRACELRVAWSNGRDVCAAVAPRRGAEPRAARRPSAVEPHGPRHRRGPEPEGHER